MAARMFGSLEEMLLLWRGKDRGFICIYIPLMTFVNVNNVWRLVGCQALAYNSCKCKANCLFVN